ncbi:hypothetical protein HPB47_008672 [Ixodes persulcatus]|uniref:Uncharacterized protein n=1 Tax=Ixodes persulcatus TaxID=34615 RepID=A0AC60P434_IXOPE|nr:hypothetical protein HPB47_008672 [Ixodes persulcatus]
MHPVSPPQPTKALTLDVSCPPGASVDSIFDAATGIVGTAELFSLQHLGASNFQLSVTSSSAMRRIVNAGALSIGGTLVPIIPVGSQVTAMTCLFLPVYVKSEALAAALAPYGKVLDIRFGVYQDHPTLRTGTRYIRMEMKESTPVMNFLRVSGHREPLTTAASDAYADSASGRATSRRPAMCPTAPAAPLLAATPPDVRPVADVAGRPT